MAEQWEINLRKLLEENANKPKVVSNIDWEKSLEKDIQDAPTVARSSWFDNLCIFVAFILLGAIVIFTIDSTSGEKMRNFLGNFKWNFSLISQPKEPKVTLESRVQKLEDETHEQFTTLLKKYDKLVTNLDAEIVRTNLMAFLLTENFMILRDNKDKNQFIFFKRDWKLSHAPQNIKINEEDMEYLQKYIVSE